MFPLQRCTDSVLSNKAVFPTFTRTIPGNGKVTKSIISLLKYYNWTCFSIVEQETVEWNEISSTLRAAAASNGIKVIIIIIIIVI